MEVLEVRAKTHGSYEENSRFCQAIKSLMQSTPNWNRLDAHQKETLEMIAHKISRLCYGDPNFVDSWKDLAGYAKLTESILEATDGSTDVRNVKVTRMNGEWHDDDSI